jgi:hypothetical protein
MEIAKCEPIPDKNSTDKFGNPTRWILRIVEPRELRGMIAFPEGFVVKPNQIYIVNIVRKGKNYAVVRLHEHVYEEVHREEDPYLIKIVSRCKCGSWRVEHIEKFAVPLVDGWKNRWYIRHATELRKRSEDVVKNAPRPTYYYVAVRNAEATERLFDTMRRRSLDEVSSVICKEHESTIYDDEERKWRTLDAWRGADDKSWVCSNSPPIGYIPVLGWVDKNTFEEYAKAKIESERLWNVAEDVLGSRIDIGRCIPDGRGGCRRYASRIAEFL